MGIDHLFKGKRDYSLVNDHLSELMLLLKPKIEPLVPHLEPHPLIEPTSWKNHTQLFRNALKCHSTLSHFDDDVDIIFSIIVMGWRGLR